MEIMSQGIILQREDKREREKVFINERESERTRGKERDIDR